jgi:hypothetical protein
VPVPGIVPQGDERFRIGDPILIKRPDGAHLVRTIGSIAPISYSHAVGLRNDVMIFIQNLTKEDIPIGSEIWSVDVKE